MLYGGAKGVASFVSFSLSLEGISEFQVGRANMAGKRPGLSGSLKLGQSAGGISFGPNWILSREFHCRSAEQYGRQNVGTLPLGLD